MRVFVFAIVMLFVAPCIAQDQPKPEDSTQPVSQQLLLAKKDLQIAQLRAEIVQLRVQLRLIQHAVFGNEAEDQVSAANQYIVNAQQIVTKLQEDAAKKKK